MIQHKSKVMALIDLGKYVLVRILLEWVKDVKSLMMLDIALNQRHRVVMKDLMCEYVGKFDIVKDKYIPVNVIVFQWLLNRDIDISNFEVVICDTCHMKELLPFAPSVRGLTFMNDALNVESIALLRCFINLSSVSVEPNVDMEILPTFVNAIIVLHRKITLQGRLWNLSNRIHLMTIMHSQLNWGIYSTSEFALKALHWFSRPDAVVYKNSLHEALVQRSNLPDPLSSLRIYEPADNVLISRLLQHHGELKSLTLQYPCSEDTMLSVATYSFNLTSLSLKCYGTIDYSCLHAASFRLKSLALSGEADGVIPPVWTAAFLNIEWLTIEDNALSPSKISWMLLSFTSLTSLNVTGCKYEASVFAATAAKLKRLEWSASGSSEAFQALLHRTAQTLLNLILDLQLLEQVGIRSAVFHSLPRLQTLAVLTYRLEDSDFPEYWVQETVEMFRPRLCELILFGVGSSDTRRNYHKIVHY